MKIPSRVLACCLVMLNASGAFVGRASDESTRKIDEFTGANWENAMAHLDNFALNLQNNPTAVGIIFVYGGQRRRRLEPNAWTACIKDYLVKRRGVDASRLVTVLGGYREHLTVELWQGPDKNQIPKPAATLKPAQVKFIGRAIKKWQSLCGL
jgi:hypothetical protein